MQFSLDGASYEIDLTAEHADPLRDCLASYVGAARSFPRLSYAERQQLVIFRAWRSTKLVPDLTSRPAATAIVTAVSYCWAAACSAPSPLRAFRKPAAVTG